MTRKQLQRIGKQSALIGDIEMRQRFYLESRFMALCAQVREIEGVVKSIQRREKRRKP